MYKEIVMTASVNELPVNYCHLILNCDGINFRIMNY